ncbi:hypothetical protein LIER_19498 [Lithospermum erythrorhizon]|uniref:Retrotransposon gag domain-containing protein n=1 Tax=Lithospermum erythrorhizon TaxID=34254 RepID=A0AAV3QKZ1_LITER
MVDPPKPADQSCKSDGSGGGNSSKPDHKDPYFTSSSDLPGTEVKPVDDLEKLLNWQCIQALLVQWVLNTIDPMIKTQISFYDKVSSLWEMLKKRYSASHTTRKQQLKVELAACIQTPSMSIEAYFGKLQPLWDKVHNLTPLPTCDFGGITEQLMAMRLEERYHEFMYGLNRELYGSIRSVLNTQNPLPSLDTAYQKIREEESMQRSHDTSIGNELVALTLRNNSRVPDYGDKSKLSCTLCKKLGHDIITCFLKVCYPEWWETRHMRGSRGGFAAGSSVASEAMPVSTSGGAGAAGVRPASTGAALNAVVGGLSRGCITWDRPVPWPVEGLEPFPR